MDDTLRAADIRARCDELQYPLMRADAAAAFSDATLETGGDETNLGVVISESGRDSFSNPDELYADLADTLGDSL